MANANIPENVLFSNHGESIHYTLVPIEEVEKRLSSGFTLWGGPVYHGEKNMLYQALIKLNLPPNLTPKEKEIFLLSRSGTRPKEIAQILRLSSATVYNYLYQIRAKINP